MNTRLIPVFQSTIQKTELWLSEIMNELDWNDPGKAYKAMRAVMHTLRDRLTIEESTDLAAQLPTLVRGMYFEGWNPSRKQPRIKKTDEFVRLVNQHFSDRDIEDLIETEDITRAVFRVMASHVSDGEIQDVIASLPTELRQLWTT